MARYGEQPAAEFTLRYELEGSTLRLTLRKIIEHIGFELISVSLPALVTVTSDQPESWLAHGNNGGDVVRLAQAKAGKLAPNSFWGEIHAVLPIIMAGHSGAICVQETTAFMDGTLLAVTGNAPRLAATLGTLQQHRVDGSGCYNMNLGRTVPNTCGNDQTLNLLIEDPSSVRFDFLAPTGAPLGWVDGAKLVRGRMPPVPNPYYHDRYIYGIRVDEPNFPAPGATFTQCEEIIRKAHALTGGASQLVHLWGWQFRGKDTGYPAVNVVDERLGGYDAMMRLKDDVRPLNADVSLSDNYDDAYRSSPAWDERYIARKPDGTLWKSRAWTGEESYIQGLAKYMEGPGTERVRYTCERYRLPGTIHVDVLSYYAIRNDWDPAHPASGIRNLRQGRYRVLEEFKKHGVDVTSEGLRYPYIGKMSMCWYAGGPSPCPFGGSPVPMLATIYRQSAMWGRNIPKGAGVEDIAWMLLFYGEAAHAILSGDVPMESITDAFYLAMAPWFLLHRRNIEGHSIDGAQSRTVLEGEDSYFDLDWQTKRYQLVLEGREVASNGSCTCPLGEDRMALYRTKAGLAEVILPKAWDAATVVAYRLFSDRREMVEPQITGGHVRMNLDARRPVMVYRNAKAAERGGTRSAIASA
ncbi:hypothetical protein SAMN05421819_4309 [Bryocella elongata]|uniref:Endo-alpha-N-acetylgalactosaminidase domain-containing protein n=1 Tax=Bryocella elongata TaxID=863522 RepID=A0A1H6C9P3_9BACT|nr:endo-alpha-N-acetylgalactosaminidase family protein [Bryocella elongata]SEG69086.1 hypothetical protein SAMN05421819_4309 [Bryocella elongata]